MTKQEIKKEILNEVFNYLKNKKAYDENPCETSEDDMNHMFLEAFTSHQWKEWKSYM